MTSWFRWSFGVLTVIVTVSGVLYLVMKYALEPTDPFAVVNHPLQPLMLHVHVLSSPWLLLLVGMLLQGHVAAKLRQSGSANRRSGLTTMVTFAIMVLSGYLLQVVVSPTWTFVLVVAHVGAGAIYAVSYGAHLVVSLASARQRTGENPTTAFAPDPNTAGQI